MKKTNPIKFFLRFGSVMLQLMLCLDSHAAPGDVDLSFDPGSGVNGGVAAVAMQPDGRVIISGTFTTVKGLIRPGLARLMGDSPFPPLVFETSPASLMLSWPIAVPNIQLQQTSDLALPDSWTPVEQGAVTGGGQITVSIPTTGVRMFYRLHSP